jgi:hypothetical protein
MSLSANRGHNRIKVGNQIVVVVELNFRKPYWAGLSLCLKKLDK